MNNFKKLLLIAVVMVVFTTCKTPDYKVYNQLKIEKVTK